MRFLAKLFASLFLVQLAGCNSSYLDEKVWKSSDLVVFLVSEWQSPQDSEPLELAHPIHSLLESRTKSANSTGSSSIVVFIGGVFDLESPLSVKSRAAVNVDLLNSIDADVVALSASDLLVGISVLESRLTEIAAEVVLSNVSVNRLNTIQRFTAVESRGDQIGFTSVVCPEKLKPIAETDIQIDDPIESLREIFKIADQSKFIVVADCGVELVRKIALLDSVLAAVQVGAPQSYSDSELQVFAFESGEPVIAELLIESVPNYSLRDSRVYGVELGRTRVQAVGDILEKYQKQVRLNTSLGNNAAFLDGSVDPYRLQSDVGSIVASAMKNETGADVGIINAGAIRSSIFPGEVHERDLSLALPFDNDIVVVELQVQALKDAIMHGLVMSVNSASFRFGAPLLQISGVRVTVSQGQIILLDSSGSSLNKADFLTVAMPRFLFGGGDGFDFKDTRAIETNLSTQDALRSAIESGGLELFVGVNPYELNPYMFHLFVQDNEK